ncbi:MAG: 16S rRNA (guanine(966)-N(2))-methyltransferase RsmD [Opitutales bacterium]|nr:16S rRNA (guanine(966)-N(2))-methyltransferase RsmD [Opitutales bacterium]
MRICGGLARGIPLQVAKGIEIRPATDANRERLFSSLGASVLETRFLDLFAGTGSYGLEALSRGANSGVLVEQHRKAVNSLQKNITNVCKSAKCEQGLVLVEHRDVIEYLKSEQSSFDLIFLDPPYSLFPKLGSQIFELIKRNQIIKKTGILIHEAPPEEESEFEGWNLVKTIGKSKKGSPLFRLFQLEN